MELIDKQKIEEAAKKHSKYHCIPKIEPELNIVRKVWFNSGFNSGAQFAQTELIPLFCEFAEWCDKNLWTKTSFHNNVFKETEGWYNTHNYKVMIEPLSTKQLFELWIKERNNPDQDKT